MPARNTMDIANLTAFIAVAETSSFSLAAEQLFLTQPAISKRIAALEQSLNIKLFDRIGRTIQLTTAGQALLPYAYQITNEIEDAHRSLSNLQTEVSGKLSLATSHHIGLHRLPTLLQRFTYTYPHVELDIRFVDSEKAYEDVLQGRVELAIVTLAAETPPPLSATFLWRDPLAFVCAPQSSLTHSPSINLSTLSQFPAVFPGIGTFTYSIIKQCFSSANLAPKVLMNTNYMETLKMLISIGLAWGVLPEIMLDSSLTRLNIDTPLERQLGYLYHKEKTRSKPASKLIELLEASTTDLV